MIAIDGIQFVRVFKSSANSNSVLVQSSRSISSQQHDIREWHRSFKGACKYLAQTNSRFSSVQFLYLFYWKELSPHIHTSTWAYNMIYFAMKMGLGLIPYTQIEVLERISWDPPYEPTTLEKTFGNTWIFFILLLSHLSS